MKYPRFIENYPCGIDKFEGQSQFRLAQAIASHLLNRDNNSTENQCKNGSHVCLPRIIGIKGGWGVGKSNVIKLLQKELTKQEKEYFFFIYDAWGHQEDLQRRSFLESFTLKLIKENQLQGKVKSSIEDKDIAWSEKFDELTAKRVTSQNTSIPEISKGAIFAALLLWLTPISAMLASLIGDKTSLSIFWLIMIAIAPLSFAIITLIYRSRVGKETGYLNILFKLTKNEDIKVKKTEIINEEEPTVAKFQYWMSLISENVKAYKIVIVFDNMDRLPSEKVKELWSSIHTFFAEDGFENIWSIITFDETHLANAFFNNNNPENRISIDQFINKTFPIVYRVASPVMTDYKEIFNKLFIEAFGDTESAAQETISRIYCIDRPDSNIREIITFINSLVKNKYLWNNDIKLTHIALYELKKNQILINPIKQIISGEYLRLLENIIPNDENLQKDLASLVYSINNKHAEQIPLTNYIENSFQLNTDFDINTVSNHNQFLRILEEVIFKSDSALIDNIVGVLSKIDTSLKQKISHEIWNFLADSKLKNNLFKQEFEDSLKILILNVDEARRAKIINAFTNNIINFLNFKGANYYLSLKNIETFLSKHNINQTIQLENLEKSPDIFIEYLDVAGADYKKYKLLSNKEALDKYILSLIPNNLEKLSCLKFLKKDKNYGFPLSVSHIESLIDSEDVSIDQFANLFELYKNLCETEPLPSSLTKEKIVSLFNDYNDERREDIYRDGYSDLIAMGLSRDVTFRIDELIIENEKEIIESIGNVMDFYAPYGVLLVKSTKSKNQLLNLVLTSMTERQIGNRLNIVTTLQNFSQIIETLGVKEEILLNKINGWSKYAIEKVNVDNLKKTITYSNFFKYTRSSNNALSKHLNKIAIECISKLPIEDLYFDGSFNSNSYWTQVLFNLISIDEISPFPENITNLCKQIIREIAKDQLALPIKDKKILDLIEKIDKRKLTSLIIDIKNDFCNRKVLMTPKKFIFFHNYLKKQGALERSNPDDVVHYILQPVILDTTCRKIILNDSDFYITIIKNAVELNFEFKELIKRLLEENHLETELISFAKELGIKLLIQKNT